MFVLDNVPLLTSVSEIMTTLQLELRMANSHYLKDVVIKQDRDIQFTCPFHKGGVESKPSAGITIRKVIRGGKTYDAGTYNCFACKERGDITKLISHCFGKDDNGVFGKSWLFERFNNFEVDNRQGIFKKMATKRLPVETVTPTYVTEEELAKYRYYHPYMYKRHLTNDIIDTFDIGYDEAFKASSSFKGIKCITFPIRDSLGNCLFVARRSIYGKMYYYPPNAIKPVVFLYECNKLFPNATELYVCESLLNSLMLIKWGVPSVCLLGTGSKEQIEELSRVRFRKLHLCLDGDEAGVRGVQKLKRALKQHKLIDVCVLPQGKDVNDFGYLKNFEEFSKNLLTN